ncbi:kynureninase [Sinosporangium siamense]|uniref:Kynureninase n=2 Tax=Sinosporangium siamense TaxID=1367973 RepID=A0A919RKW2_9ACTN|nr:kynureninase [Sinosporangium siamense]
MTREECAALDAADPLKHFRDEFALPDGMIYLTGNSLGAMPKSAPERISAAVNDEWANRLVGGWNSARWYNQPTDLGDGIAPLIGAGPGQVVVGDSTSVVIYKAMAAAARLRPDRRVIVSDLSNFPTDRYVVEGLVKGLGGGYEIRDIGDLGTALGDDVAAVLLSQVDYRTGARRDMAAVTAQVHAAGAIMVWDLCHSVGAFPVDVGDADFALGCTYKYVNGGPGSPAFLYVAPRHQADAENVLSGWYGHAEPFAFEPHFRPAEGVRRFAVSTPHVLSGVALSAALEMWKRVDLHAVRAKSVALTSLFIDLVEAGGDRGLTLASPRDPDERGSQVSFLHPDGYPVMRALIDRGVHGDYRAPSLLRFGFAPLYLRYVDVWDAAALIGEVLDKELWRDERYAQRLAVT